MQKAFGVYNRENKEKLRVRIALHSGDVIREADDLFGRALNFVARMSAIPKEGQILASAHFKDLVDQEATVTFRARRAIELRGFTGKHFVYAVLAR